jgi:3-oxoacyl-[acyl-carrier-protein] synthase II
MIATRARRRRRRSAKRSTSFAAGRASACVAGGATTMVTPFYLVGFSWLQVLALDQDGPDDAPARACRPFDRSRRGFALAEGGAALVLEPLAAARARGATVLAEVLGFGASQDAYDLNRPPPDGEAAELCMRRALDDARLAPDAIAPSTRTARERAPAIPPRPPRSAGCWARAGRTPVSSLKGALGPRDVGVGRARGGGRDRVEPHRRRPADRKPGAARRRLRCSTTSSARRAPSRPGRCSPARSGWAARTRR